MIVAVRPLILAAAVLTAVLSRPARAQEEPARRDSLSAQPTVARPAGQPEGLRPTAAADARLQVEVGCSRAEPGTGMATLSWPADRELIARQRVDVTVFKRGFERGLFASLSPSPAGQRFQMAPDFQAAGQPASSALELRAEPMELSARGDRVALRVKGLEPGLLYFWRLVTRSDGTWRPGETVRTEAATCPVDWIRPHRSREQP
ncbi:MAG: hypothetical protein HY703_09540 [Gemmatimonadetes bacterium]|nr:hypothetical protein [Gemmatimonadota bacterium]